MEPRRPKQQKHTKRCDPVRFGTIRTIGEQEERNIKDGNSLTTKLYQKVSITCNVSNIYN